MKTTGRIALCLSLLLSGVAAQASLERMSRIERPPLRRELASLPLTLGGWVGVDFPVDSKILAESQATEYVSRSYTHPKYPGVALSLWINYSRIGDNMRHSPKICLPGHGWTEVESQTCVLPIPAPGGRLNPVTRLSYEREKAIQGVGFWYYIFGEGAVERWIRGLPITSRSSHGRTTRGSGMTVEVFWTGDGEDRLAALQDFSQAILEGLEPILPEGRATYHVP